MVLNAIDFPEKEFMRRNIPFIPLQIIFYTESSRETRLVMRSSHNSSIIYDGVFKWNNSKLPTIRQIKDTTISEIKKPVGLYLSDLIFSFLLFTKSFFVNP
jgi:hypothetical protein